MRINKLKKYSLVDLFILKYLLFYSHWTNKKMIYIYIYIYISSSSWHATSTDIPDSLLPLSAIVLRFWQVLWATSHILTELLYVGSSWSCEGVHSRTSLMSSSLLLQQCPVCLVCLTCIVFVMGGRWPDSCCFVGCYLQDLFKIAFLCSCRQDFSLSV